jgi:hypothetical protein
MQQLMQPCEGKLGLRLDSDGGQGPSAKISGSPTGALQERRLADPCFAPDHQRSTTLLEAIENVVQEL